MSCLDPTTIKRPPQPKGGSFGAGTRELVQVNLAAAPEVTGPFPLSLTDQLVTRCVADAFANELPVSYVNATVTVNPLNPNLLLVITKADTNVVLTWPGWAADFSVQALAASNAWSGNWSNQPVVLQTNGPAVSATLPIAAESRFFRLAKP